MESLKIFRKTKQKHVIILKDADKGRTVAILNKIYYKTKILRNETIYKLIISIIKNDKILHNSKKKERTS